MHGHLTETASLSIKSGVHLALARGEATAVVLLDLPTIFNTIDHSMLIECLCPWFVLRCGSSLIQVLPL